MRRLAAAACASVLGVVASACAPARIAPRSHGHPLEVMAVWTGSEQGNFQRVLSAFSSETGTPVTYTAAPGGVPTALDKRLAEHDPPDVAFLPQPGALRRYASAGALVPLNTATQREVARNYSPVWRALATQGGREYGVWFKAADKSLVWYNVGAFEAAGVVPPATVAGLVDVARTLVGAGTAAFAVGAADPWTLADWFANLYLRVAGPARYDQLAAHRLPWTDASVKETLRVLSTVLTPDAIAGGTAGALGTSFTASVAAIATDPPTAAMTSEAEFVLGALPSGAPVDVGTDIDMFPFPAVGAPTPGVVVGGDVAVLLRRSPEGNALLRYLATPNAAAAWASQGGFVSPNLNLDLAIYPNDVVRAVARSVLEAGDGLRFGLGDLQPPSFGADSSQGLRRALRDFLVSGDVDGTASELEQAAIAAYAP